MVKKRKRITKESIRDSWTRGPLHPETWPLAILTALIDPEGVSQSELTNTRPKAFFAALHLLRSIDDWVKGPSENYYSPEEVKSAKDLKLGLIAQSWPLLNGEPFSMKDAVNQEWCGYKTERNLSKFLRRNQYPFHFFELGKVPVYITREAYEKALANDRERERKMDRARKSKPKEELQPKIAGGHSDSENGIKRGASGKQRRTSGK